MDGNLRPSRNHGNSPFDEIRNVEVDPDRGEFEYWSAREAMSPLGYSRWENMENVIKKAKRACSNCGQEVTDHFRDITKLQPGSQVPSRDVQMTRFGMYLLAMNGDPAKREIANAQRYFAVQTRKAEIASTAPVVPLPDLKPMRFVQSWAKRFQRTFSPHVRDLYDLHPGCFTVVSAVVAEILWIEEEIVRHQMTTRAFDRPDISIGRTWGDYRRATGMSPPSKSAPLHLPDQKLDVEVHVYDGSEWPAFTVWFRRDYLRLKLPSYFDNKKELKEYAPIVRASAADNACRELSGKPAQIKDHLRKELRAAGGFVPAKQLPPGGSPPKLN